MKKLLVVLTMLGGSVFFARPAMADETTPIDTTVAVATTTETTPTETVPTETVPAETVPAETVPTKDVGPVSPTDQAPPSEDAEPPVHEPDPDVAQVRVAAHGQASGEVTPATASAPSRTVERSAAAPAALAAPAAPAAGKVWVCKYVGTPGVDERLKGGKNPISVSDSTVGGAGVGAYFPDGQARSFVLAIDNGGPAPDVSACPAGAIPTTVTPEAPLVVAPNCSADGSISLPTTPGVIYTITPTFTGAGSYTVSAVAATNYVLATGSTTSFPAVVLAQLSGAACANPPDTSNDSANVKICHATSATDNPYNTIPPATAAVANGHDSQHNGPIYPEPNWGDIIEPYVYNGVSYPGQNWADGEAIYENGCLSLVEVEPVPPTIANTCGQDGHVTLPADTAGIHYAFTIGDGVTGAWEITATVQPGHVFAAGVDPTASGTVVAPGACAGNQSAVPVVTVEQACDGGHIPTSAAVNGVSYAFTVGSGLAGPWTITATAQNGFVFDNGTQFVFSGNAGSGAECVTPIDDDNPAGEEGQEQTVIEDVAARDDDLPDTGGLPLWALLLAGPMAAAGVLILMRSRPAHSFVSGSGSDYSLTLPPRKDPAMPTAVARRGGLVAAVRGLLGAVRSYLLGRG